MVCQLTPPLSVFLFFFFFNLYSLRCWGEKRKISVRLGQTICSITRWKFDSFVCSVKDKWYRLPGPENHLINFPPRGDSWYFRLPASSVLPITFLSGCWHAEIASANMDAFFKWDKFMVSFWSGTFMCWIYFTGNNTQFLSFGACSSNTRGIAKPIPRPASYSLHHTLLACGQPYLTGTYIFLLL